MASSGYNRHKKSSSFSGLFNIFKGGSSSSRRQQRGDDTKEYDQYVQACKVYPSDEDRVGWWDVAEPGIDKKASAYISLTTHKWEMD